MPHKIEDHDGRINKINNIKQNYQMVPRHAEAMNDDTKGQHQEIDEM